MGKMLTKEEWVSKAVSIHGDKYDYSNTEYLGSMKKLEIFCRSCNKIFKQYGNDHTSKKAGCPYCKGVAKLTTEEFISRSTEIHKGKFDYSKSVYVNSDTLLTVTCPTHGDIQVKPHGHLRGHDCDKCSKTYKLTTEEFVRRSKDKFGDKFDYSETEYVDMDTNLTLICRQNGRFLVTPRSHFSCTSGYNLEFRQKYVGEIPNSSQDLHNKPAMVKNWKPASLEHFVARSKEAHGEKYLYHKVEYSSNKRNVMITCPIHGDFLQHPHNHYSGSGCPKCFAAKGASKQEEILASNLSGVIRHDNSFGVELDLLIPEHNVAVEVNGIYFHSDRIPNKNRHSRKTKVCLDAGVKLFHFTDADVNTKLPIVLSMINNSCGMSKKIFARNLTLRCVDYAEAKSFFENNHISESATFSKAYGLYSDGTLVCCMSFAKARFSKEYEWEIIRFATILNTVVVGGASKLFKEFIRDVRPSSVMSFADRRFGDGGVYIHLGMHYVRTTDVGYSYHSKNKVISRFKAQKHKLPALLGEKFDPNLSERDNMLKSGYYKLYDCGHNVYAINLT